jgi:hypothetical protein
MLKSPGLPYIELKVNTVLCDVTICSLGGRYQRSVIVYLKDRDKNFL